MRKPILIILAVLAVLLLWYFFVKKGDYQINFEAKANAGTVSQTVKLWSESLEDSEVLDWDGLESVEQEIRFNDSVHRYYWDFNQVHDSLTKVTLRVTDVNNSLKNRLAVPFNDTDFEKRSRASALDFGAKLNEHLEQINVKVIGVEDLGTTYCACVEERTTQFGKAGGMMRNYVYISNTLANNEVALNGVPMVEITHWDREKDSIAFDFCFPILRSEKLPYIKNIKYRRLFDKKVLKAEYNGNYITSDRAWYSLMNYAEENGYEVAGLPIEFFFNNPNMGGDALRWKAEIYLPIEE